jgi:hypothetical protein
VRGTPIRDTRPRKTHAREMHAYERHRRACVLRFPTLDAPMKSPETGPPEANQGPIQNEELAYGNALQAVSAKGHDQIVQRLLEEGRRQRAGRTLW